ncbi:MAG: thiamine pyrophosphate-dependent enzyme [Candidatus Geothermarchaeales archaeon]
MRGDEHPLSRILRTELLPHEFCPGCGIGNVFHYAAKAVDELNLDLDKVVFLTGIGCSCRGVAYVRFDSAITLHGRTLPFATGVKLANPELNVVALMGDGDCAGIGGNHLIHAARRNLDVTAIVLNNEVYGSTGGQLAPTTRHGAYSPTSPYGNVEYPFDLCRLAEAAGAIYVARWTTVHMRSVIESIKRGIQKGGFAFIEIYSQCPTHFGRRILKVDSPADILEYYRRVSVRKEKAEKMSEEELEGKIIVGEFVDRERPPLTQRHEELRRAASSAKPQQQ